MVKRYNATTRNLYYRLRAFKDNLPDLLQDTILNNEEAIVSAIADDQLYRRGINGKSVKIAHYAPYAVSTIKIKKRKGQPTTRVTLRDTGDFHRAMRVVVDEEGFYITSDDPKTDMLVAKYGEEIFRLTDKNFTRIVRSHLRKSIVRELKRTIKKK